MVLPAKVLYPKVKNAADAVAVCELMELMGSTYTSIFPAGSEVHGSSLVNTVQVAGVFDDIEEADKCEDVLITFGHIQSRNTGGPTGS